MTIAITTRTDPGIQADVIAGLKWEPRVQARAVLPDAHRDQLKSLPKFGNA